MYIKNNTQEADIAQSPTPNKYDWRYNSCSYFILNSE